MPAPEVYPKVDHVQEANLGVDLVLEVDLEAGHDRGADLGQEVGHGLSVVLGLAADLVVEQGESSELLNTVNLFLLNHT